MKLIFFCRFVNTLDDDRRYSGYSDCRGLPCPADYGRPYFVDYIFSQSNQLQSLGEKKVSVTGKS